MTGKAIISVLLGKIWQVPFSGTTVVAYSTVTVTIRLSVFFLHVFELLVSSEVLQKGCLIVC